MMSRHKQGIVVATRGRLFEVRSEDGTRMKCEIRQKVKTESDAVTPVAVGDNVLFSLSDDNRGTIEKVLPRQSRFARPAKGMEGRIQVIAANIDRLAIVVSIRSPELKTGLIDRFIISALSGNMAPFVIVNKVDLKPTGDLEQIVETYRSLDYQVFLVSAKSGSGLDELRKNLNGHRTIFVGHSGVGKSSLLNQLIPGLGLKTKAVSAYSDRGTHATTSIELYELPTGGFIVDSPGLKVLGLNKVLPEDLPHYYPEFEPYLAECRFSTCTHIHEPDCAVKEAVSEGVIAAFRYENYCAIAETL
jgi:ribosome biogenesis GTPase